MVHARGGGDRLPCSDAPLEDHDAARLRRLRGDGPPGRGPDRRHSRAPPLSARAQELGGFRQVAFPYERDRRRKGRATYTVWRLLDLAVSGIVSFSVIPLRLVALAGATISALSLAAGLVVLLGQMPVLAGVVAALAFCFGLQLLVIGMLGEYVGRVLEEVQNRPIFVVDEVVGLDPTRVARDRAAE